MCLEDIMLSYEQLIQMIDLDCFRNKGKSSFELKPFPTIHWSKSYCAKDYLLLFARWECIKSSDEQCVEVEKILLNLPIGITYKKETSVITPLPDKVKNLATEKLITEYTVSVSKEYAEKVFRGSANTKVLVSRVFDSITLQEAERFKNAVLSSHAEVIEILYLQGLPYGLLENNGFTNYDTGFTFKSIKMKPLLNEAQRLGVALALTEYGVPFLPEEQFYYISRHSNSIISIAKEKHLSEPYLNDWV